MSSPAPTSSVVVSGSFDNLRSGHVRLLQEAARLGSVQVLLWSDDVVHRLTGRNPRFPLAERRYLTEFLRFVDRVWVPDGEDAASAIAAGGLPSFPGLSPDLWVWDEAGETAAGKTYCTERGLPWAVVSAADLAGFPESSLPPLDPIRSRVVVTGCYDWLHSGHVRFFEEASELGELFVVVGHDANVRLLKGGGHPLQTQDERRYMVQAVSHVARCLVSTGHGWMDAEPEIASIRPRAYVVNEDGDKPEKAAFCAAHGLDYIVLKRVPRAGLTRRSSSDLRGF